MTTIRKEQIINNIKFKVTQALLTVFVSLIEVEKHWSIDDVADAHQALDYFTHCEYIQMRKLKK